MSTSNQYSMSAIPETNAETNGHSSGRQLSTVYLTPTQNSKISGIWGLLIKFFHLDVYGNKLLSRRALFDMKALAILLVIVFSFDMAAWTLFWNMVFNSGRLDFSWIFTPLALVFALMISTIVIVYERQWVVADVSRVTWRIILAFLSRLAVILIAAFATAQPVEVITFGGQIQKRIHAQSVLTEAKRILPTYNTLVDEAGERVKTQTSIRDIKQAENETAAKEAAVKLDRLKGDVTAAEKSIDSAEAALSIAKARYNRRFPKSSQARINAAQRQLESARNQLNDAQRALAANEESITRITGTAEVTTAELIKKQDEARVKMQQIKNWILAVANMKPGGDEITEPNFNWSFKDKDYDFFERYFILNDLVAGRPPNWGDATPAEIADIIKEFGVGESPIGQVPTTEQQLLLERRTTDAQTLRYWWWAVFLVALVIPLLVLAAKLLMSRDLISYYSEQAQMTNLNYDSISLNVVYDEHTQRLVLRGFQSE